MDPQKEAAYWREQHSKQPVREELLLEQFEDAYRTGCNSFFKYPGKKTGVGKLLRQGFRRIANGGVTFQNAMFAEQDDVAFNIALAPACQMIVEHFNR